jgi:protein-disulfide isomerase
MTGQKNKIRAVVSAGIAVVLIVVILLILLAFKGGSSTLGIENSPVLGNANAPVTIYEFSDFSCPYCAAAEGKNYQVMAYLQSKNPGWEAPMPKIKEEYVKSGKVKIVFKYYPGHDSGVPVHAVALGLKEQSPQLFWQFAEYAFENQGKLNDLVQMKDEAKTLGADIEKLEAYLQSGAYQEQMQSDISMGKSKGIQGTPTFFINGKTISGAQPFSIFQDAIESALK